MIGIDFETARGHSEMPPKGFAEIVRGTVAALLRQILDRETASPGKLHGPL
jgi:hypothetical protein